MDKVFKALAEPRRIEILRLLKRGELPAGAVADQFDVTRPAVSQHLRVLADAGLIRERRDGTRRLYSLDDRGIAQLKELLEEFWDSRLSQLKRAAENAEASMGKQDGKSTPGRLPRALHRRKP